MVAHGLDALYKPRGLPPRPLNLLAPSLPRTVAGHTPEADQSAIAESQTESLLRTSLRGREVLVQLRYKDRLYHLYCTHLRTYHAHRPWAVQCEMAIFIPLGEHAEFRAAVMAHWRDLSNAGCTLHDFGGDNKTMLHAPQTGLLVQAFEGVLREAAQARQEVVAAPSSVDFIPALPRQRGAARAISHSAGLDEND